MARKTTAAEDAAKSSQEAVAVWFKELEAARKREETFRKNGQRILNIYDATKDDDKAEDTPFNILYSNTETLHPALYSTLPRPVVQRRFKDEDPLGKAAADAGKRVLEFLLDTNLDNYTTYDDAFKFSTLDALLPGRAVISLKYDNETEEQPTEGEESTSYLKSELVCPEHRQWNRVLFGYAKSWVKVPWVSYEEYIDKAEAERLFDKEIAAKLVFSKEEPETDAKNKKVEDDKHQGERETCRIYQIWDKDGGRKVRYISEAYTEGFLKEEEDPLGLTGFFNCPKPLQFFQKTHSLIPTALYVLYESQAKELNELTRRIKHVTKAIKARGLYDGELGVDLEKLMEASDAELVPCDKSSSLAAEKGLQNAIWFMPVQELIITLRELYAAREQCKQVIYEITGISDILRGATKASETLGAQKIKTQWGGLRLKRYQNEVARYVRDLLRMTLELAANKFSEETWAKMTGLPFLLSTQYNELTAVAQALQQQLAMVPPAMAGPQGAPAPPPQVQQLQQIKQQLQAPQWSQVLALLKNDLQRAYRIDIETNSTIEPDATEDKEMITEVMTAIGQVLNGVGPLVAKGVLPFEAAQVMLLTIIRRFRFGTELEDTIKAMKQPQPEQDGAAQAQAAQQQLQLQQKQAEAEISFQYKQEQMALQEKTMQAEMQAKQREMDLAMQEMELQMKQKQFQMEQQMATQSLQVKAQSEGQKLDFKQKTAEMENKKYKTENVVNKKADDTLGQGMREMKGLVQQLAQLVSSQGEGHQKMMDGMMKTLSAPRRKKAIRGKDGRIEAMEEEVAAPAA
jgi:hypothetical protein